MTYFDNRLVKSLKDGDFPKEWKESEADYLADSHEILRRLAQVESYPSSTIPWNEIKRT